MPRVVRKSKKKKPTDTKRTLTACEQVARELEKHPDWREAKPVSSEEKKKLLSTALDRPLKKEEVDKLEQAIFDKRHRGEKPDLTLVQALWNTAINETNKVQYRNIYDKEGNVVGKEPIVDYRRKQQNHILKIIKITPPILGDRSSLIDTIQQYLTICLEDGIALSVNGLALALGTTRETLKKWVNGETRVENKDIIEQAFEMISLQTEMDIREGKGNPVGQIFLGKNDSGYVDEVKHTINTSKIDDIDEEEILKKYIGETIDMTEKKGTKKSDH